MKVDNIKPTVKVEKSDGAIEDQGYSYNEAGQTYNEAGVSYGGFYGYSDVIPLISQVYNPVPTAIIGKDQGNGGYSITRTSIGPGWFMFITKLDS